MVFCFVFKSNTSQAQYVSLEQATYIRTGTLVYKNNAGELRSMMCIIIIDMLQFHYIPGQSSEWIAMLRVVVIAVQGLAELKAK